MKIKDVLVMAAIGLLGAACSDDDNKGSQWGDGVGGTKTNLDVSAYDKWTYVNLKTGDTSGYKRMDLYGWFGKRAKSEGNYRYRMAYRHTPL